jgi:uncharacterized delta-60 repeat protein
MRIIDMKFETKIGSKAIGLGTVSALALVASIAWAAGGAGTLDATFGAGEEDGTPAGVVATSLGNGDDIAEDLSVGADGIVTVVGNRHNGESNDIVIVRYTAEGAFDAGFGVGEDDGTPNGVVNISLGEGNDFGTAIATQADGKVIVAGYHEEGASTNMVVLRVNADGTLDEGFGTADDGTANGIVNISLGDGNDVARDVVLQADGKIVVVGDSVVADGSTNIIVARLNADGSVDESFGQSEDGTPNGFVATSLGDGNDTAYAVALDADGKIVVAGSRVAEDGSSNMLVARYDAAGVPDATFGASGDDGTPEGFVNVSLGDGNDAARDLALQADGKIVVAGDSVSADGSSNFIVARLNADGTPDEAFGVSEDGTPNGFVSTSLGEGNDFATGVAVQADGQIVVAGYHQEGDSTNIAVARYDAAGALDQGFGTADDGTENGIVNISLGDGDDMATGVAVQGDKLIVVAGTTTATDGSKNIAVLRLTAQ